VGPIEVDSTSLILRMNSAVGWPSGHARDVEDTIAFTKLHGIKCVVESFKFEEAQKGYERMLSGDVRFRSVLVM
jgi:D-arabinose 1-dehydrogenase-like Zn-dependent alcohol dehydrogenase